MKFFAFPITITTTIYSPGVDKRDARNRIDPIQWMESVTQGDATVQIGPAIETNATTDTQQKGA